MSRTRGLVFRILGVLAAITAFSSPLCASTGELGATLPLWSVIPFTGLLLSIAILPLLLPKFWHHHFGKVSLAWSLLFIAPFGFGHGFGTCAVLVGHVYVLEFIPFLILLWALYTIAGGIEITGTLRGGPGVNTVILALGTILASWMGTTGAAMLLIRPLLRANSWRRHRAHTVVFFIFLVANLGGCLTPLGDPPLFLGFLQGVSFFWTFGQLGFPLLIAAPILLLAYFALDSYWMSREDPAVRPRKVDGLRLGLEGGINVLLLLGVVVVILISGSFAHHDGFHDRAASEVFRPDLEHQAGRVKASLRELEGASGPAVATAKLRLLEDRRALNGIRADMNTAGIRGWALPGGIVVPWMNVVRDGAMLVFGFLALRLTKRETRERNAFSWAPMVEVAKLFAGIFVTIVPAVEILKAGPSGAMKDLVLAITDDRGTAVDALYFWFCGALSSFLDNAPTYLVFFNTAGGNAAWLMDEGAKTLFAISLGSVFMGANTYIGNAPNFMVRSMAVEAGVAMPSFFGYILKYVLPFLIPVFVLLTVVFF